MPRTYRPSTRMRYKKYDQLVIETALSEYNNNQHSLAEVASKYGISKSVLYRHNTRIMKKHGGQTVVSSEIEDYIVDNLNHCSKWGYPLDTYDLRLLVKGCLDRVGVNVRRFNDNLPGPDFVKSFLRRHESQISVRTCQNIKRCPAPLSTEVIEKYFKELQQSLADVPLTNIVNYDETNLSDDPGRRKVIIKRDAKYPERIMNHSKGANSVMIAATADGKLLPYYVVYKSVNLYNSWMEQGPLNSRCNCTKSGWFDSITFEDWVHTIVMPYFDKLKGKKILIGDNLSTHLSINLIKECKEKDIHFVFLPAYSAHLTQPLDVALFRNIKMAWRDILLNWKKNKGRNLSTVPKTVFPKLLKKLLLKVDNRVVENIKAGFLKTGISPVNKNKVLERLTAHKTRQEIEDSSKEAMDQTVLAILKSVRYNKETKHYPRRKKNYLKSEQSVILADYEYYNAMTDVHSNSFSYEEISSIEGKIKNNIFFKAAKPNTQSKECSEKLTGGNSEKIWTRNDVGEPVAKRNKIDKNDIPSTSSQYVIVEETEQIHTRNEKSESVPKITKNYISSRPNKYGKLKVIGKRSCVATFNNNKTTEYNTEIFNDNIITNFNKYELAKKCINSLISYNESNNEESFIPDQESMDIEITENKWDATLKLINKQEIMRQKTTDDVKDTDTKNTTVVVKKILKKLKTKQKENLNSNTNASFLPYSESTAKKIAPIKIEKKNILKRVFRISFPRINNSLIIIC